MDKGLREVEPALLHRQASHRPCSNVPPFLPRSDILRFVDGHPNL